MTAPDGVNTLGGVSRGGQELLGSTPRPGEVGAGEGYWAEVRGCRGNLRAGETTALISLVK